MSDDILARLVQPCPRTPDRNQVTVRAALFFDGTLNNRANVAAGIDHEFGGEGTSYAGDYTNIAKLDKLFQAYEDADYSINIYIEGIATDDLKEDSGRGMALGTGDYGVEEKVEKGIAELAVRLSLSLPLETDISLLTVDVYGFSRGAAAARNFIFQLGLNNGAALKSQLSEVCIGSIHFKFVGLFDTVASFGVAHFNDTADLHLDAIRDAERVVQLAAAEEHRANFRLTNIDSASNGLEVFLPGVHSDVGGGYNAEVDEDQIVFRAFHLHGLPEEFSSQVLYEEIRWLMEAGWCRQSDLTIVNGGKSIRMRRRGISNTYARIPLHLMSRFAEEYGCKFKRQELTTIHGIPPELQQAWSVLESYATTASDSAPTDWFGVNTPMLRALRASHLHFSAYYGATMGAHDPQWASGVPKTGTRERVIQHG